MPTAITMAWVGHSVASVSLCVCLCVMYAHSLKVKQLEL